MYLSSKKLNRKLKEPIIKNFIATHNTSTDSEVDYNTIRDIIIDQLSILPELLAFNSVNEFKNTINTILE